MSQSMDSQRKPSSGPRTTLDVDLGDLPVVSADTDPARSGERPEPAAAAGSRSLPRRLALGVGSVVPGTPYRLHRWLGDGGMGAVFEAEHIDTERRVAVKVLHAQRRSLKWVVDGFRNEARASARIGSPNIVDIYDFKELDDGRLLIAMEFLDGPTLHEELDSERLTWPRVVAIARQVCKGLSAAHEAGIIHRDIKPENIIVTQRDQREDFVKLLDFGVALFTHDGGTVRMSGTAQYMAPESIEGVSDGRADIYSVGCLLYALVVGEPPFGGDTPSDVLDKQRVEEPLPPSQQAGRSIPEDFDALVLKCLAKQADDRFQSMDELEAALCELQIAHGWATAWDDLPPPNVEPERQARIEAGIGAIRNRSRRGSPWPWVLVAALAVALATTVIVWPRAETTPVVDDAFERHEQAAQRAAARFYFVYPSRNDPERHTAYRELLALEALGHEAATTRGAELREQFADTLVRLGDRYWDFEGARPFAYEYYASALVFVESDHARSRTGLSPAGLERLRNRAAAADFTELELLATEPLVALADPDRDTRVKKLQTLQDEQIIPASLAASLDRVLEHPEHRDRRVARAKPTTPRAPKVMPSPDATDSAPPTGTSEDTSQPSSSTSGGSSASASELGFDDDGARAGPALRRNPPRSRRDPSAARKLVAQATKAAAAGDRSRAEALYNQALEADPRNVDALDGLASIAFRKAHYAQSVKHREQAVKLGPRSPKRWVALGDAYFKTLRYSDARKAYQRALELGSSTAPGRLQKLDRKLGITRE